MAEKSIREETEEQEDRMLSPFASRSSCSQGRDVPEEKCRIRTDYQRDRDRIIHCKSFRRLKHKTQVFISPAGDHYRTRLTHTLEVAQIGRTIARALRLNEDLTEAIALGHDIGHAPFGHAGEAVLNEVCPGGFAHYIQSVRVVEKLEKGGQGLNLTKEVRDGILNHRTSGKPGTMEGKVIRLADKIAYINHDIDDAIRAGILREADLPEEYTSVLGHSVHDRLDTLVNDIIMNSRGIPDIVMDERVSKAMSGLRAYMFTHVYLNSAAKSEDSKAKNMLAQIYHYYMEHTDELPEEYRQLVEKSGDSWARVVCDYVAGMTDGYAIDTFNRLFVPITWKY